MKRIVAVAAALIVGAAGCAKGPDGGPTPPQALNRLEVSMRLQQPVNPAYFYSFAFDDDGNSATGPVAITGATSLQNGIVGGDFTVLVEFAAGQFNVFRRARGGNGEVLTRAPSAFVTAPPSPINSTEIRFTLNLDATLPDGSRLFRGSSNSIPDALDINFVTSDERRRDTNDLRLKTFDAFFARRSSSYFTLRGLSTRSEDNNTSGVREPANDVFSGDTTRNVNVAQLDITDFRIAIQRNSS
jgi:hypothetical protein